jgi:hypothetical protein
LITLEEPPGEFHLLQVKVERKPDRLEVCLIGDASEIRPKVSVAWSATEVGAGDLKARLDLSAALAAQFDSLRSGNFPYAPMTRWNIEVMDVLARLTDLTRGDVEGLLRRNAEAAFQSWHRFRGTGHEPALANPAVGPWDGGPVVHLAAVECVRDRRNSPDAALHEIVLNFMLHELLRDSLGQADDAEIRAFLDEPLRRLADAKKVSEEFLSKKGVVEEQGTAVQALLRTNVPQLQANAKTLLELKLRGRGREATAGGSAWLVDPKRLESVKIPLKLEPSALLQAFQQDPTWVRALSSPGYGFGYLQAASAAMDSESIAFWLKGQTITPIKGMVSRPDNGYRVEARTKGVHNR